MQGYNPVHTPRPRSELSVDQPPETHSGLEETKNYRAIVGALLRLSRCTRYDIAYSVMQLTRASSKRGKAHLTRANHLLLYLKGYPDLELTYTLGRSRSTTSGTRVSLLTQTKDDLYQDAYSWMTGGPVSWTSALEKLTAQSTVKAELIALAHAAREAVFLGNMMTELKVGDEEQQVLLDHSSWLESNNTPRKKHCGLRLFFLKEQVDGRKIVLKRVASQDNISDLLTKYVTRANMSKLLRLIQG